MTQTTTASEPAVEPRSPAFDAPRHAQESLIPEARQRQRRRQHWIASLVAAVVLASGVAFMWGAGASRPSRPAGATAKVAAVTTYPSCAITQLAASIPGQASGAAGTFYYQLRLVNTGSTCMVPPIAVRGYSSVAHAWVGPWSRVEATSHVKVSLAKGRVAYVAVGVGDTGNYPTNLCYPQRVTTLRVAANSNRALVVPVALATSVCTTTQSLHTQSPQLSDQG